MNTGVGELNLERVLIVHADLDMRTALERMLREINTGSLSLSMASTMGEALETARHFNAKVIILDLENDADLALESASLLRKSDRLLIGAYNPITQGATVGELLQQAARAGVNDCISLPPSKGNLTTALQALHLTQTLIVDKGESDVITFYSPAGGVGTTSLALNTALLLAAPSPVPNVVLVDADLQFGDVANMLDLSAQNDFCEFVDEIDQIDSVISYCQTEPNSGLRFLASPRNLPDGLRITPKNFNRVLVMLKRGFKQVVIDTASAFDLITFSALELSNTICLVTDPMTSSIRNTAKVLRLLEAEGFSEDRIVVILNRMGAFEFMRNSSEITRELRRDVDHVLPYDKAMIAAVDQGRPLALQGRKSKLAKGLEKLAEELAAAGTPVQGGRRTFA